MKRTKKSDRQKIEAEQRALAQMLEAAPTLATVAASSVVMAMELLEPLRSKPTAKTA